MRAQNPLCGSFCDFSSFAAAFPTLDLDKLNISLNVSQYNDRGQPIPIFLASPSFLANSEKFALGLGMWELPYKRNLKSSELSPEATIRKYRIVQKEGNRQVYREVDFYDLNVHAIKQSNMIAANVQKNIEFLLATYWERRCKEKF